MSEKCKTREKAIVLKKFYLSKIQYAKSSIKSEILKFDWQKS